MLIPCRDLERCFVPFHRDSIRASLLIVEFYFCSTAKVLPHAFTIQQLSGDGQSPAACRLVSPGSQPLPQQQHPRPAVPPGSQIIPLQQNAVFLTSNCLSSTAIPAGALSIPVTSIDSRHSNEQ